MRIIFINLFCSSSSLSSSSSSVLCYAQNHVNWLKRGRKKTGWVSCWAKEDIFSRIFSGWPRWRSSYSTISFILACSKGSSSLEGLARVSMYLNNGNENEMKRTEEREEKKRRLNENSQEEGEKLDDGIWLEKRSSFVWKEINRRRNPTRHI